VNASGALLVEQTLETDTSRQDSVPHPLDRFGINWMLPFTPDTLIGYGLAGNDKTDSLPSIHSTPPSLQMTNLRWCTLRDRSNKGSRLTADSHLLYLAPIPSAGGTIHIDAAPIPPHPTPPVYFHYAFKITPLTTIPPHPAAKPF